MGKTFKVLVFGMKFSAQVFPFVFVMSIVLFILQGITWGITAFVTQHFFDSVGDALTGDGTFNRAFLMISLLGLTIAVKEAMSGIPGIMSAQMLEKSMGRMNQLLHLKIARIAPICLEDTKLHDDIEKARNGAWTVAYITNLVMALLTFYPAYFVVMGIYLHHLRPQFLLALLMVFVPVMLCQFIRTGIMAKFEDKAAPIRREYDYYQKTIADREYFKETRLLGGYPFFLGRLTKKLAALNRAELSANFKTSVLELFMGLLSAAGYVGILFMLVSALLAGEITVGAFAAVFGSVAMLFSLMNQVFNIQFGGISSYLGMAYNFVRFLELPERTDKGGKPDYSQGIIAENISFTYPHAENESIDNISLRIEPGETVAIVGGNGAGKTTLVRLLIGLYTPTSGKVILNGLDTAETGNALFSGTSGVFQRFQRYQMTLAENIRISQIDSNKDIANAADQAGVNIDGASFPKGRETMLSREFDGVDLSGGEWQRVAIARGLYRSHNLVILDEPTAAIDPIEESRVYRQFMSISRGKTAIIVTHRLGSTKMADRVIVMDKGKIVDIGSHNDLLTRGGLYAEMFNAQASWYEKQQ